MTTRTILVIGAAAIGLFVATVWIPFSVDNSAPPVAPPAATIARPRMGAVPPPPPPPPPPPR